MIKPYLIDAFVGQGLRGNPAAVVPLEEWLPDGELQAMATKIGVSDTAFLLRKKSYYDLRWFTPALEIDLCGHATLAAAHWHFSGQKRQADKILFKTRKAGELSVTRAGNSLTMDFPSRPPLPWGEGRGEGKPPRAAEGPRLKAALGLMPQETLFHRDLFCVFASEAEVRSLKPDQEMLKALEGHGVIVTAPGLKSDFVSRFFAPKAGIPEDPVTGSAHCVLAPYWASRLGKTRLHAVQVSERGGEIFCKVQGDRVLLTGRCSEPLQK